MTMMMVFQFKDVFESEIAKFPKPFISVNTDWALTVFREWRSSNGVRRRATVPGRSLGECLINPCSFKYSQEQTLAMSLSDIFKKDLEHRHDHHDSAFTGSSMASFLSV